MHVMQRSLNYHKYVPAGSRNYFLNNLRPTLRNVFGEVRVKYNAPVWEKNKCNKYFVKKKKYCVIVKLRNLLNLTISRAPKLRIFVEDFSVID